MNNQQATDLLRDANQRIKNALGTCEVLAKELTEERKKTEQQADQLDFLAGALMHLMTRHRYDHLNIEKTKLAELGKREFIYFEVDPQSSLVFVEKRLRAIPFSEAVKECATETPGNTGETPSDSTEKPETTTSHYEHNPNSDLTALPS